MHIDKITNTLNDFGLWCRAFTPQELLELSGVKGDSKVLQCALLNDKRFISLEASYENFFIAASALFRWFARLTTRLARAHLAKLTAQQLAHSMSSLRLRGQWNTPLAEVINGSSRISVITDG